MNMWFPSQLSMRKDVGFKTSFDGKQGMNRMFELLELRYVPLVWQTHDNHKNIQWMGRKKPGTTGPQFGTS